MQPLVAQADRVKAITNAMGVFIGADMRPNSVKDFLVYNIHGLVHLSQDIKMYGNLDLFSCFPISKFLRVA